MGMELWGKDGFCIGIWISVLIVTLVSVFLSQQPDNRETGYSNVLERVVREQQQMAPVVLSPIIF